MKTDIFITKAEKFIKDKTLIKSGDKIVMGVSGGADSVALLLLLNSLKVKMSLSLYVVHVNHCLRPEADSEALYVETLCKERGIPFFLRKVDIKALSRELKIGTEDAGRKARYEAFESVLDEVGATKIAVAHNCNDRAETMLFNLARGTGIKGLISIPAKRDNIVRPLLFATRAEIEEFLTGEGVRFCTDASNLTDDYARNRIRNNILPALEDSINGGATLHMFETAEQLSGLYEFALKRCEECYKDACVSETETKVSLDARKILTMDEYLQSMLIKQAIDTLVPGNRDITHVHLSDVLSLLKKNGTKSVNLPYNITAVSSYDTLTLTREGIVSESLSETEIVPDGSSFKASGYTVKAEVLDNSEGFDYGKLKYTKCFDYGKIKDILVMRSRRTGDTISVTSGGGTKKLKDYMIDVKIPAGIRDSVPVIACGSDVLWVVGYRISENYKVTKETKRVIRITVLKED
ncbi:tRNA(Ile)-lysidine synthase [Lachnospiraceae bacterium YSD2013]|nr:tRNA(Ile)-lysidine synthase [Lachnospiraceae bacterium YSD2013]